MSQDPFEKDHHLKNKLNEYHVEVPDFPMKANRWERFIRFLASPAKDPLEPLISTNNGLIALTLAPVIAAAAFALIQFFIFLL